MAQKVVWLDGDNIFVVRKGKTSNKKIAESKDEIVQTYTFSLEQWLLATTESGFGMKKFFELDESNCLDCPYSGNSGNGGCYTHKFNQYVGFLSMLRSINKDELTPLSTTKQLECIKLSFNSYVRFGTYGEPSLLPLDVVKQMATVASSYTGYTHQWVKTSVYGHADYFMASVHNEDEADFAKGLGWRSFIATTKGDENAVQCPASNEAGFKTNCAACGLCSGRLGKGNKNVKINEH